MLKKNLRFINTHKLWHNKDMKHFIYTLSFVLIASCTTMQTSSLDRETSCQVEFYNQYWGNCYIESTESDPNFFTLLDKSGIGEKSWELFKLQSKDIEALISSNTISVFDGNRMFKGLIIDIQAIQDAKNQQRAEQWQAIGQALSNTGNPYNPNNSGSNTGGMLYTLESSYMSGSNRICIYKLGSQTATHTISGIGLCPISKRF